MRTAVRKKLCVRVGTYLHARPDAQQHHLVGRDAKPAADGCPRFRRLRLCKWHWEHYVAPDMSAMVQSPPDVALMDDDVCDRPTQPEHVVGMVQEGDRWAAHSKCHDWDDVVPIVVQDDQVRPLAGRARACAARTNGHVGNGRMRQSPPAVAIAVCSQPGTALAALCGQQTASDMTRGLLRSIGGSSGCARRPRPLAWRCAAHDAVQMPARRTQLRASHTRQIGQTSRAAGSPGRPSANRPVWLNSQNSAAKRVNEAIARRCRWSRPSSASRSAYAAIVS